MTRVTKNTSQGQSKPRRHGRVRQLAVSSLALATFLGGCHYQRAYISYPVTTGGLPVHSNALEVQAISEVWASEGGPVWKTCTRVAEGAIWVLIERTKALGGNAVGNVRWFPEEPRLAPREAVCKQKWGFILLWPILATPAFQRTRVEATAYRVEEGGQEKALYAIPDDPSARAELVRRIVRETLPVEP